MVDQVKTSIIVAVAAGISSVTAGIGYWLATRRFEILLKRQGNVRMRDTFKESMNYYLSNLAEHRYALGNAGVYKKSYSSLDAQAQTRV